MAMIAVIGSVDHPDKAHYEPELCHKEQVEDALRQIGRELAARNYQIRLYSTNPALVERSVVSGYIASGSAKPGSIQVRYIWKGGEKRDTYLEESSPAMEGD